MVDGKLKQTNASRLAWIYTNGEINDSTVCVCHKCDNPLCCNPDHLFLGTNAVNTADKVAKGRQPKGEEMPAAKLTEDNVRAIKAEYRPGKDGISYRDLSWKYDVSQETIRDIIKGRLWKHVQ
jgi:ribosome-binding protein aMBF1 (putative translation factor)